MLEGLRVASQNWIGRAIMGVVMGFIVISFAVWGIGDVFRGFSSQRLVKIGGGEVTVEAFRSAYQNELRRLQQRLRRAITNEEARRAGLDQQVLDRLITDVALDQRARSLGLAISEEDTQRLLKAEKVFQGPGGQFDADRFKQIVRDAGFSERSFVNDQKGAYLRKEITDVVTAGLEPPPVMLEAIFRFRNETRAVDTILLPPSAAGAVAPPTEDEIKKYYADHEGAFRAREYRKLTTLAATPAALAKPAEVADDEVRKLYDEVKSQRYGAPEKREVGQIVFKTEAEAKDALTRLKGGLDFSALASERKLNPKDVDLGLVYERDFGDPKVGAAVFALPAPGFAGPTATPFGFVVSQIRKIQPAVFSKSFDQAQSELRKEIAARKAAPEVRRIHDAIEDQRSAGKSLAETAKAVGVEIRELEPVDDQGRGKNGTAVADLPGGADLLKAAFASDKGVDNEAVSVRDGGYVWFEVADIEQARQQSFDEVKAQVESKMRKDAEEKALAAKANELVEQLRGGKPIDNLSGELGLQVKRVADLKRANRPDFPASTIIQFFEVPLHGAGSVAVDGGQLVFVAAESTLPKFDASSPEVLAIAEQLRPALQNDLLEQYVGGLEKAMNVQINQKALEAALGGEGEK
ncbi:SurA N-terminal domain-containing protein [Methylocystis heyeri]|uniref:Parvulin-like PPIase n=1 Tax=Methylocystis heyeri TaxID=391905 RepID=A0A6B8KF84_9HYPH|nr:SurA N-terminal domain-containing protein [Methylocystis heyeri]QGM46966.1 peptidylprolyl isomerase [Methylocystis heyeri]